eukprot:TRINITY_DN6227_c0_g1_i1.p1 TRINITY_DN6227_c0_g1~~TRINITY_DN6227_c0_g1_i1.p1  ORF type:complete len:188 (+),score=47.65 TRINITY_DN6227_c0_g1_i1:35-598(+)
MFGFLKRGLSAVTGSATPAYIWIDPAKRILKEGIKETQLRLDKKLKIDTNSSIFRFRLEQEDLCLGTRVAEGVRLLKPDRSLSAPYVPISRIDDLGFVDFLVHFHSNAKKSEAATEFPSYLDSLKENDQVLCEGPVGRLAYLGSGQFSLKPDQNGEAKQVGSRYVGMIAQNTGITGFFQVRTSSSGL